MFDQKKTMSKAKVMIRVKNNKVAAYVPKSWVKIAMMIVMITMMTMTAKVVIVNCKYV